MPPMNMDESECTVKRGEDSGNQRGPVAFMMASRFSSALSPITRSRRAPAIARRTDSTRSETTVGTAGMSLSCHLRWGIARRMRHMMRYLYAFPRDRCTSPSKPNFTDATVGAARSSDFLDGVHWHPCSTVHVSPTEQFSHSYAGVVVHRAGARTGCQQACC